MDRNKIKEFIIESFSSFLRENDLSTVEINIEKVVLIGSRSPLDSMDLVNFIVELEENLEEELGLAIALTDEHAMSQRTSPFLNISTLSEYVCKKMNINH